MEYASYEGEIGRGLFGGFERGWGSQWRYSEVDLWVVYKVELGIFIRECR